MTSWLRCVLAETKGAEQKIKIRLDGIQVCPHEILGLIYGCQHHLNSVEMRASSDMPGFFHGMPNTIIVKSLVNSTKKCGWTRLGDRSEKLRLLATWK